MLGIEKIILLHFLQSTFQKVLFGTFQKIEKVFLYDFYAF